ncbi:Na+/H+ antiporter NhaC family protein [Pontibacillus yanchengensis]|uniref:Na+/H+ antiporter NhaC family protein n=2 Tax=Pontibacillus yanchengensis TaxID=462910 RepID=A0ACC7VCD2_9BACI|nr:Na+/H+ antiporter NhaC family protein [Pontibacillus yanchengensis]MYL35328.1 Na+/H+ antiporter NhaC family protein [Pontibacillus yanchengensis]MYL52357.1 Na+/H+ antiporter NhaC family protein [Pontibacillus yanchengensis]
MKQSAQANPLSLLPFIVFLATFFLAGMITGDFYQVSMLIPAVLAAITSLLISKKISLSSRVEQFAQGAGHPDIMIMVMIFLLSGAFSAVANGIGSVDSTVNFALTYLPQNMIIVGIFIIGSFISLAMGTSVGTISALAPIAVGISGETELPTAITVATVVGGAMFGDNLSIISDTTIAAVRTQKTEMKDKFKTNFFIVMPAAFITIGTLFVITLGSTSTVSAESFEWVNILPYLGVLIAALLGANVLAVLLGGILLAGIIGLTTSDYSLMKFMEQITSGMTGMAELILLTIILGGIVAMIQNNGGIQFIMNALSKGVRSKKGAEASIAGLVSTTNLATANNTIAIITTGQLVKQISDNYQIDPRKSASLLDIFSCTIQGLIPYGAQLLTAAQFGEISPLAIIPYSFYPMLIAVMGTIAISTNFPRFKTSS